MSERVSMLQIADWLVQSGVDPDRLSTVSRNADKLANVFVPMAPGWQNAPPELVIGKLARGGTQSYTDETGEASPPALSVPAAEMIDMGAYDPRIVNQEVPGGEEAAVGGDLAGLYGDLADFGIEAPPGLDVAALPYMAPPPPVSLPDIGGMPSGYPDDRGYGNNESGRDYSRLPFVPDQNDNYIEGAFGPSFDGQGRFNGGGGDSASGGSGQGASQTYWNLRNKLENLGGGSYGSSSYPDYSGGGTGYYDSTEAKLPKNRGFSAKYDEEQLAGTIQGRPTSILPRIARDESAAGYQYLADMPVDALMQLTDAGTRRKSWYGKSRTKKNGYVIPPKFKQGKYTNNLEDVYRELQAGGGSVLDPEEMMQNLLNARRKSYVGQQFSRKVGAGEQAEAMSQHLDTIRFAGGHAGALGTDILQGAENRDEYMIDTYAEQNMRRKKARRATRYMQQHGYGV